MVMVNEYPKYLYHKEHDEPQRVDNKAEETDMKNKGWTIRYLFKEFPKMVNGVIVNSKKDEDLLLGKPKVEVKKTVFDSTGAVISDTGPMAPVVGEPPLKGLVQVPKDKGFEMLSPAGEPVPDLHYDTWPEAQAAQKDLNVKVPGHKARKID